MDKTFDNFQVLNENFQTSFGSPELGVRLETNEPVPVLFNTYTENPDGSLETHINEKLCTDFVAYTKALPQAFGYNCVVCPIKPGTKEPLTVEEGRGPNDIEQTRGKSLSETLDGFDMYCESWLNEEGTHSDN